MAAARCPEWGNLFGAPARFEHCRYDGETGRDQALAVAVVVMVGADRSGGHPWGDDRRHAERHPVARGRNTSAAAAAVGDRDYRESPASAKGRARV